MKVTKELHKSVSLICEITFINFLRTDFFYLKKIFFINNRNIYFSDTFINNALISYNK